MASLTNIAEKNSKSSLESRFTPEIKKILALISKSQVYKRIVEHGKDMEYIIRRLCDNGDFYEKLGISPRNINSTDVEIAVRYYRSQNQESQLF